MQWHGLFLHTVDGKVFEWVLSQECIGYMARLTYAFTVVCNVSVQGGNRIVLRTQVREAFRKNKEESDPEEIEKQKDAAIRGLSNYMFFEAQRMAAENIENGQDTKDG